MKKNNSSGFVLAETLVVTTFVAGMLIFLFIQFTNLSKNYNDTYKYNNVDDLYLLRNVRDYIISDSSALNDIETTINNKKYIDITNCDIFAEKEYCLKLFELDKIKKIIITNNDFDTKTFNSFNEGFKTFVNKIDAYGNEKYRMLVEFNNSRYATIRFGESNE